MVCLTNYFVIVNRFLCYLSYDTWQITKEWVIIMDFCGGSTTVYERRTSDKSKNALKALFGYVLSASLRTLIGGHVGRVLLQCLFFVFVLLAFYLLVRSYLRRNKQRMLLTTIPTPNFTDEQTQGMRTDSIE